MKTPPEKIKEAADTLMLAMQEDGIDLGSYSHAWFCNIKMPCYDEILAYDPAAIYEDSGTMSEQDILKLSAKIANRLMQHLFNINTDYE